jgi:hypothetical protein
MARLSDWRPALAVPAALAALVAYTVGVSPARSAPNRSRSSVLTKPLVFGIYPGGAAGTVGPSGRPVVDDFQAQLNALQALRAPGRPFVLHLYASYTGLRSASAEAQVGSQIAAYTAAGFQTELVLAYRPAERNPSTDVQGFVSFVREAVATFGSNPNFLSVQVTNEANVSGAPNAADGYYPGVMDALVKGVVAAKATAKQHGFRQITVGFNCAYAAGQSETRFWRRLAGAGAEFRQALDWVGLDVYPGTWGPRAAGPDLAVSAAKTTSDAISALRASLRRAHIPSGVALHIAENGYPTGSGRTPEMQETVMRAAIAAVNSRRAADHITDYRWFDLRDANSASSSFEDHYGLLTDSYAPKPAFETYRGLIAELGTTDRHKLRARTRRPRVLAAVWPRGLRAL